VGYQMLPNDDVARSFNGHLQMVVSISRPAMASMKHSSELIIHMIQIKTFMVHTTYEILVHIRELRAGTCVVLDVSAMWKC